MKKLINPFVLNLTEDNLRQLYLNNNMTVQGIADMLGSTYGSINYHINNYGLSKRANGVKVGLNIDKELLYQYYFIDKLTLVEIAEKFNCTYYSIMKYLKLYGFHRINGNDNSEYFDIVKAMYIDQLKSITMISQELNIPKSRVRQILIQAGVTLRNKSECQQIFNIGYKSFGNDWNLMNDTLIKRCRAYFSNHIAPLINKVYCEDCGVISEEAILHIHHLKELSVIVQEIRFENPYDTDDELFQKIIHDYRFLDLSNLKVVCEKCHYTIYHPYAKYNLTDNQQPSL